MSTARLWSERKRPLDIVVTASHRIPICDDNLIHVTDYIGRSDWMSFLLVSKQFLICGTSWASGITPAYDNYECLHWVCRENKRWSVMTLLEDPRCDWYHCPGNYSFTPLGIAAFHGYYDVCQLLLGHGIDPNRPDRMNITALDDLLMGGGTPNVCEICKLLVDAKADVTNMRLCDLRASWHFTGRDVGPITELLKTYGAKE